MQHNSSGKALSVESICLGVFCVYTVMQRDVHLIIWYGIGVHIYKRQVRDTDLEKGGSSMIESCGVDFALSVWSSDEYVTGSSVHLDCKGYFWSFR